MLGKSLHCAVRFLACRVLCGIAHCSRHKKTPIATRSGSGRAKVGSNQRRSAQQQPLGVHQCLGTDLIIQSNLHPGLNMGYAMICIWLTCHHNSGASLLVPFGADKIRRENASPRSATRRISNPAVKRKSRTPVGGSPQPRTSAHNSISYNEYHAIYSIRIINHTHECDHIYVYIYI